MASHNQICKYHTTASLGHLCSILDICGTMAVADDLESAATLQSVHVKQSISQDSKHDGPLDKPELDQAIKQDSVVDWDGPDDGQNPQNWPKWKRMTQVALAAGFLLTA